MKNGSAYTEIRTLPLPDPLLVGERRRARHDPCDRGMLTALDSSQSRRWRPAPVLGNSTNGRIFAVDPLQIQSAFTVDSCQSCGSLSRDLIAPPPPNSCRNQADGVRTLACRYRRRIAPAVGFQCLPDRLRVTKFKRHQRDGDRSIGLLARRLANGGILVRLVG
jgi:hypothetical protein